MKMDCRLSLKEMVPASFAERVVQFTGVRCPNRFALLARSVLEPETNCTAWFGFSFDSHGGDVLASYSSKFSEPRVARNVQHLQDSVRRGSLRFPAAVSHFQDNILKIISGSHRASPASVRATETISDCGIQVQTISVHANCDTEQFNLDDASLRVISRGYGVISDLYWDSDDFKAKYGDSLKLCRRLKFICPELTLRERQVCILIVQGLTSEGISIEMNVSINTILTFRRRAYSKINISNSNELLHRIIGQ